MKKLFAFTAAALACTVALAANEQVPPDALLLNLPSGSKLLLKRSVSISQKNALTGSYIAHIGPATIYSIEGSVTLSAGEVIDIERVKSPVVGRYNVHLTGPLGFYLDDDIRTVGDFTRVLGNTLRIVYDDPNADLLDMPVEMRQDIFMTRVLDSIKANRYDEALPDFERLEKLGKPQPESFYYYYIVALDKAQRPTQAKERAVEFLKTYGKQSKYYNDVLAIMAK